MVDSLIRLFNITDTNFTTNGIGSLPDAISCVVTEERNGSFTLEMEYPINGIRYNDIQLRRLIVCNPNMFDAPQAFRIYEIERPINGITTIRAAHISYDLSNYIFRAYTWAAATSSSMITGRPSYLRNPGEWFEYIKSDESDQYHMFPCKTGHGVECPFKMESDITISPENYSIFTGFNRDNKFITMRSFIGDEDEDSLLNIYGGELKYDNYNIQLLANRGSDNGILIRYGKNLTDLTMNENDAETYNAVMPYFTKDGYHMRLSQHQPFLYVNDTKPDFIKPYALDVSSLYEDDEKVGPGDLSKLGKAWLSNSENTGFITNIKVSFVQLSQTEEYKDYAILEDVRLCDYVTVQYHALGVNVKTKVVKTEYDVLAKRYNEIELGEIGSTLSNTLSNLSGNNSSASVINTATTNTISQVIGSKTYRITEVKKINDTSISVSAVPSNYVKNESTGENEYVDDETEPTVNVYSISEEDGITTFTNLVNSTTIKFIGW